MSEELQNATGLQNALLDTLVKIDLKGLAADVEFRGTIHKQAELLDKYITTPMNFDALAITALEKQITAWLDSMKAKMPGGGGGLVVGAMAPSPQESATAVTALAGLGSFDAGIVAKVKANPKVMDVISHRSKEQQAKILNSEWLDKIIGWITTYGPVIAKLLMFLIPLL